MKPGARIALFLFGAGCSDPLPTAAVERAEIAAPSGPRRSAREEMMRERAGVAVVRSDARDAWVVPVGERVVASVPWRGLISTFETAAGVEVLAGGPRTGRVRIEVGPESGERWWQAEVDLAAAEPRWMPVHHKIGNHGDELRVAFAAQWVGEPPEGADLVRAAFEVPRGARAAPAAPTGAPNVLLITVDTLRADRLGCAGYERAKTPHIDALAARGTRFANAYSSAPWTLPSYGSLFTGLYPGIHRAGVVTEREALFGKDEDAPAKLTTEMLRADLPTLAESFARAGWWTGMLHNNPYLARMSGLERGFARYVEYGSNAKNGVDAAVETIDDVRSAPWLLVLHLMDPHFPYAPPAPYDAQHAGKSIDELASWPPNLAELRAGRPAEEIARLSSDLYDGEIAFTDAQIGRLLDELRQRDLLANTIVVLHSDHGEEFWEHGGCDHGHTQYEELLRVPLVIAWPERVPAGKVVDIRVRSLDLFATLLELSGIPVPPHVESRSVMSAVSTLEAHREAISESVHSGRRELKAIVDGRYKLIASGMGEDRCFDLDSDAGELVDLASEHLDRWEMRRSKLMQHFARSKDAAKSARALRLAESERDRIHRLGYGGTDEPTGRKQ